MPFWRRKKKKPARVPSNILPPLHGGYRPSEGSSRRSVPDSYPIPPKGRGGGSK